MNLLQNKVIFVTGAGSGIGRAAAALFAREGARIAACDRDAGAGNATVDLIRSSGGEALFVPADVAATTEVEHAIHLTATTFGRLDGAFNNAGVGPRAVGSAGMKTGDMTEESWNAMLDINLSGVWRCMKAELSYMKAQNAGSIVNTSSIAGLVGLPQCASYVAAKHAIVGLTRTAALEYAEHNIRINAICPGFTTTAISVFAVGVAGVDPTPLVPMKRWGAPGEIAELALWLLSDRASFVSGAAYAIDGGYTAT